MCENDQDRRQGARQPGAREFAVLVDEVSYPARLIDISHGGLQVQLDALTFDEIREQIDAVRFGPAPPLSVTLHWGFFDGRFGASFNDRVMAAPIVEAVMADERQTTADPFG